MILWNRRMLTQLQSRPVPLIAAWCTSKTVLGNVALCFFISPGLLQPFAWCKMKICQIKNANIFNQNLLLLLCSGANNDRYKSQIKNFFLQYEKKYFISSMWKGLLVKEMPITEYQRAFLTPMSSGLVNANRMLRKPRKPVLVIRKPVLLWFWENNVHKFSKTLDCECHLSFAEATKVRK